MNAEELSLVCAAAMMLRLRNYSEATLLHQKICAAMAIKGTRNAFLQSSLALCDILLSSEEELHVTRLTEMLNVDADTKQLSAYKKSVIHFRLYQISGEQEHLAQCLVYCQAEDVRAMFANFESYKK